MLQVSVQTSEDTALNSKQQRLNRGNIIELWFDPDCDSDISECDKSDSNVRVNWHMVRKEWLITSH